MNIMIHAAALVILLWYVGRTGYHSHAFIALLLVSTWLATVLWQQRTGQFAPFPDLSVIDFLAFGVLVLHRMRYRWEAALAATFWVDILVHMAFNLTPVGPGTAYVAVLHGVAYSQVALLAAMAWHARRGFSKAPSWLDWLSRTFTGGAAS